MTYPTTIVTQTNPSSSDFLDTSGVQHDVQHSTLNDTVHALEVKVGIDSSADPTSQDYLISHHRHTGGDGSAQATLAGSLSDVAISSVIEGQAPVYDVATTKYINRTVEHLVASVAGVDLNTATATTLFTVPSGRNLIVTRIIVRLASISLTTASVSFGYNSTSFNDVIATATHTELTGSTLFTILVPKVGAIRGTAADVLKVKANVLQGSAATVTIDVFGYLY